MMENSDDTNPSKYFNTKFLKYNLDIVCVIYLFNFSFRHKSLQIISEIKVY